MGEGGIEDEHEDDDTSPSFPLPGRGGEGEETGIEDDDDDFRPGVPWGTGPVNPGVNSHGSVLMVDASNLFNRR